MVPVNVQPCCVVACEVFQHIASATQPTRGTWFFFGISSEVWTQSWTQPWLPLLVLYFGCLVRLGWLGYSHRARVVVVLLYNILSPSWRQASEWRERDESNNSININLAVDFTVILGGGGCVQRYAAVLALLAPLSVCLSALSCVSRTQSPLPSSSLPPCSAVLTRRWLCSPRCSWWPPPCPQPPPQPPLCCGCPACSRRSRPPFRPPAYLT